QPPPIDSPTSLNRVLSMQYSSFLKILLALVSGAFLVLAFAPFHFSIFSLLCPAVLLLLWRSASPTLAFWEGLFFGFGFFGCGVSWVFVSIDEFGGVDAFGSGLITAGFVILLALFPALQGYCLNRFFKVRGVLYSIFAFPATWIVAELLRGWILTGFPWLTLGEAEIHLPLKGFIPVLGASGAGLVTLVISGLLPLLFNRSWRTRVISAVTILALFLMGFGLTHVHFTYPKDHAVQVTLIQGNIPQSLKWNENTLSLSLSTYQSLTEQHWDSDDIFWPESAIPLFNMNEPESFIAALRQAAQDSTDLQKLEARRGLLVDRFGPKAYRARLLYLCKNWDEFGKDRSTEVREIRPNPTTTILVTIVTVVLAPDSELEITRESILPILKEHNDIEWLIKADN
ncbi:MAG: hypothetical protein EBX40_08290, partial [Gammaproteobacteria bacterium]|nr:hypothetical protein [Gammaproteobacteria bacterium]